MKKTFGREKNGFYGIFPRSTSGVYNGKHFINKGAYLKYKKHLETVASVSTHPIISLEDEEFSSEELELVDAFNK